MAAQLRLQVKATSPVGMRKMAIRTATVVEDVAAVAAHKDKVTASVARVPLATGAR